MTARNYSAIATATTVVGSLTDVVTAITVASVTGWPAAPFTAALERATSSEEVVLVTAVNTGTKTFTVTRGYNGTTARAHGASVACEHVVSAIDFSEANTHVNASAGVHGLTGTVVGTTDTQTLTNKTLGAGTVLPASVPLGWLGYAEVTTSQTGITTTDLTGLTVTITAGSARRLKLSFSVLMQQQTSSGLVEVRIAEGATQIKRSVSQLGVGDFHELTGEITITPTAGAHTYKLVGVTSAATVAVNATATDPSCFLVMDVGAA